MKKIQYNNLISSYARALFCISENRLSIIRKEVEFLLAFFKGQRDILTYLSHPVISLVNKKELILSINRDLNENLIKFIMIIYVNRRFDLLIPVLEKFLDFVKESKNELEITIKSAETLKKSDIKIIAESLRFLGKIIKVNSVVDPAIIGGFIIRYGFNLIDVSLKSYLNKLVDLSKVEILKIGNRV